jgi:hypothetical protein
MMKPRFAILTLVILLTLPLAVQSQQLVLSGQAAYENGVHLSWIPLNDTLWGEGLERGYTLRRTELATGQSMVLASGLQPRTQSWFEENKTAENGFLYLIGQVLYAPDFLEQEATRDENRRLQYHYLMYEAELNPAVAAALGLGFFDTTGVEGVAYRYEVTCAREDGTTMSGSVEFEYDTFRLSVRNPEDIELVFEPPGGVPLSRLRSDYGQVNRIEVIAKAWGDSIVLRWAPNNPLYWKGTNIAGYALFKEVYSRVPGMDSIAVDFVLLDSIYPWPLERFNRPEVIADSMALIAAQCLHGERMTSDEDGFINQLAESEMRYGMAMLAADRSPLAAEALGLRYVDREVVKGGVYRYVLITAAAENTAENAFIEVNNVRDTLSTVQGFSARSAESAVILQWSKLNDQQFSGYFLERSADGGRTFIRLNDSPLLFIANRYAQPDSDYEFRDSLGENYRPYLYRIYGIDAFGDLSTAAQTTGMGRDFTPPPTPNITFAEPNASGAIELHWEMPEAVPDLAKFHVFIGEKVEGPFEPAALDLPPSRRSYVYAAPLDTRRSYYFLLAAEDTAANRSTTMPVYVHLVDSIPPAPPQKLAGKIDSNGIVTLTWEHGTEPDLIGYRVYVGNNPEHEFAQITIEPTAYNFWRDTIELIALDKQVYYKVVAEDRSHNLSAFSEILTLRRPDFVPPAAPAMLPASSSAEGVTLQWMPSPSQDVEAYLLYRRLAASDTAQWQLLAAVNDARTTGWMDTIARIETIYQYTIRAKDESGLLSEYAFPVKGRRAFDGSLLSVEGLEARYDAEMQAMHLRWNFRRTAAGLEGQDYQFYLYRALDEGGWVKIRQLSGSTFAYLDRDLRQEGQYAYAIKVVALDGKAGELSAAPPVAFPPGR